MDKNASDVTVAMWLAAYMNLLRDGYKFSGGATSVDINVKFSVASFSLVCYFFSIGTCIFGVFGSTLIVGGGCFSTLRTCGVSPTNLRTGRVNFSTLVT